MDSISDSDSEDAGSIPAEATNLPLMLVDLYTNNYQENNFI